MLKCEKGFTIIDLAIIMCIFGLIIGSAIKYGLPAATQDRVSKFEKGDIVCHRLNCENTHMMVTQVFKYAHYNRYILKTSSDDFGHVGLKEYEIMPIPGAQPAITHALQVVSPTKKTIVDDTPTFDPSRSNPYDR